MNKRIKRLICIVLTVSGFSTIAPANNLNLLLGKAYAYSSSDDVAFLEDIDLNHGNLSFSKTKTSYSVNVSSSVEEIELTAEPKDSDYEITIDGETKTGKWTKALDLDRGKNTFKIRVNDPSGENGSITYYVHITRGSASDDDDDDEEIYLDNITLSEGNISFSRTKTSYSVNVADSVDEIRIKAEPEEDDDIVKINGTEVDEDDKYRKSISLSKGKNVIQIEIENEDDEYKKTYTLNIYRGGTAETNTAGDVDDSQDDIFLDDIVLEDGDVPINFKSKVTSYAVDVKEEWDDLIIKAEPEDEDNEVRINGDKAEEDSKFIRRVILNKGKNVIKIEVSNEQDYDPDDEDDYLERIYTLVVYRGTSEGSAVSQINSSNGNIDKGVKINQWINSNGKWQYNDATGTPLKNTWFFDKSSGKNYYLQADGSMAIGWISNNGSWYYLDEGGAMQTGWKQVGYSWYYLDAQGKMKTGWFKDSDGKYYYLYPSGAMAYNTTIGGFKLGSNGAWTR